MLNPNLSKAILGLKMLQEFHPTVHLDGDGFSSVAVMHAMDMFWPMVGESEYLS